MFRFFWDEALVGGGSVAVRRSATQCDAVHFEKRPKDRCCSKYAVRRSRVPAESRFLHAEKN